MLYSLILPATASYLFNYAQIARFSEPADLQTACFALEINNSTASSDTGRIPARAGQLPETAFFGRTIFA
jgi:hypothetical protein